MENSYINGLEGFEHSFAAEPHGLPCVPAVDSALLIAFTKFTASCRLDGEHRIHLTPSRLRRKNIAAALDTTIGYLLGKSKKHEVLKDIAMLKRLNDIASFPDEDKKHIESSPLNRSD